MLGNSALVTARITGLEAPKPNGGRCPNIRWHWGLGMGTRNSGTNAAKMHVVAGAGHFTPFLKSKIPVSI